MNKIEDLNYLCSNTMVSHLGIEFTESGEGFLKAKMPVDHRTNHPSGILHGGASFALAEAIGSAASYLLVDREEYNVVCIQLSGNHMLKVSTGIVYAHAQIIHQGSKTHVWDIRIKDENDATASVMRLTNMITEIQV